MNFYVGPRLIQQAIFPTVIMSTIPPDPQHPDFGDLRDGNWGIDMQGGCDRCLLMLMAIAAPVSLAGVLSEGYGG